MLKKPAVFTRKGNQFVLFQIVESDSFKYNTSEGRPCIIRTSDEEEAILQEMKENPRTGTKKFTAVNIC